MNIDIFDEKARGLFRDLAHSAQEARGLGLNFKTVLADALKAMKREIRRAEVADEWERVEIVQMRGPTVEFTGRLLASTEFTAKGGALDMALEIWETKARALVAVSSGVMAGREREDARVTVVPPTDDVQAMRFAVLDAFDWDNRARSMARKLGWSLRLEVE
jgi:hypothetical protein